MAADNPHQAMYDVTFQPKKQTATSCVAITYFSHAINNNSKYSHQPLMLYRRIAGRIHNPLVFPVDLLGSNLCPVQTL